MRAMLVFQIFSKLHCRNHCTTGIILLLLMRRTVWSLTGLKEQYMGRIGNYPFRFLTGENALTLV